MYKLLSLTLVLLAPLCAEDLPRVFLLDAKVVRERRADPGLTAAAHAGADKAMTRGPFSVTQKATLPPSGDKHDYMSQAPYYWPDPAKPNGLPYLRKDGQRNPEVAGLTDHANMDRVAEDSESLALAWYFSGDEKYAARAALLLRTWFLDEATRMNPNLNFGQAIPGVNDGRGIGIIESRGLTAVVDAVGLLAGSKNWSDADRQGMERWFGSYLKWLQESKNGRDEANSKNNHGTYYDLQIADFALFTHQEALAKRALTESRSKRIAAQIAPDGRQPLETERTRGISYSMMNLSGLTSLAALGDRVGVDFWSYRTKDGRSIGQAIEWLAPYVSGQKKWPYKQIAPYDAAEFVTCLLRAAAHDQAARLLTPAMLQDAGNDVPTLLLRASIEK
jgi:hypothetical protein